MGTTTFSGPVVSTNGFTGAVTGNITGNVTGNLTGNVTGTVSGGITSGATNTEINARADDSAMVETIAAAGALAPALAVSQLALAGAGAVTLAVPTKPAFIKVVKMTTDNGDVTLAMTNIVGNLVGVNTTITFNDVGDSVTLCSDIATGLWTLLAYNGVTLS